MEYSASKIERLYYKNQFSLLSYKLRDYITSLLQDVFQEDLRGLVSSLIRVNGNYPPTLSRDFLVDGCSGTYKNFLKGILNTSTNDISILKNILRTLHSQQDLDQLFHARLEEVPDQQAFLKQALMYADVSSTLNTLQYLQGSKKQILIQKCGLQNYNSMKTSARIVREARNAYLGHESQIPGDTASREYFTFNIEHISQLAEFLNYEPLHEKAETIISYCSEAGSRVMLEPLLFEVLKKDISGFKSNLLYYSKYDRFTDFLKETVYLTKETEIDEFFHVFSAENNSELYTILENIMSKLDSINSSAERSEDTMYDSESAFEEVLPGNTPEVTESMPLLPSLFSYVSGHLSDEQTKEVLTNSTIFADESLWLSNMHQNYLSRVLVPMLEMYHVKLAVDWVTRAAIRKIMLDDSDMRQEVAKTADNTISFLHKTGRLIYAPVQKGSADVEANLIDLVRKNMDKRIVILTQKKDFTGRLAQEDLPNLLPLWVAANELSVRMSAREMVIPFAKYGSVSTGDAEEPSSSQSETGEDDCTEEQLTEKPVCKTVQTAEKTPEKTSETRSVMPLDQEFKKETGILIPVLHYPLLNDTVRSSDGKPVVLTKELGRGGEGTVYSTDRDGLAAKIYHKEMLTETRRDKLILMTQHNPHIRQLCWPEDTLYTDNQEFVGFLMPAVNTEYQDLTHSVLQLAKESVRNNIMPGWDRLSLERLCRQTVYVFTQMHKKGILMGDVNPNNIMIDISNNEKPDVMIVDCDSMQFGGYPCPVGMKAYTSPEIYKRQNTDNPHYGEFLREENDELYAIASLLFHILMLNGSPYEGKGVESIDSAIRNYNFSYRTKNSTGKDTPDGPYRMIWNNTIPSVKNAFATVFTGEGIVSLSDWYRRLKKYDEAMLQGKYSRELIPDKYWDTPDHEHNEYFVCEWCGAETNMPKERFEKYKNIKMPKLCPSCNGIFRSMKYRVITPELDQEIPRTFTCEVCHKPYTIDNYYDAYLTGLEVNDKKHKKICPDCRGRKHYINCSYCGKPIAYSADEYLKKRDNNKIYCDDCQRPVTLTCAECGKEFTDRYMYQDVRDRKGRNYYCQECRKKWRKQ